MSVEETKKYEEAREKNRKKTSSVRGSSQNPNTNCGRAEQRERSVGEGPNLGSNRNNPDRVVSNRERVGNIIVEAHGVSNPDTTPDQIVRRHEKAPVASEGSIDNRKTVKSGVTLGRHVQSDNGFKIADRRSAHVRSERKNTERTFDSRRKRSSTV